MWDGTSWSIQPTPNPAGGFENSLSGVSCTSSSACTAVGYYYNSSFVSFALAEAWNGTSWSIQRTPHLAPESHVLRAVSCTSPSACTAVGSLGYATLAEVWNGTSWSVQKTPQLPPGSGLNALTGVSCLSASACTAVWSSGFRTVAAVWNGTKWSLQRTPSPNGSPRHVLSSVSCAPAGGLHRRGVLRQQL